MTVTVALIDDHIVFRDAFRALLASNPEFSVVAEGQEGQEACPLYEATHPDVVVMDVTLPGTDGLTATRDLTRPPRC
jgi:DNA-binding NarL/FixJ family response regulator